jgi:hypothetical protein
MSIGALPIAEIEFDVFNRHELVPILMALQHVYVNRPQLLEEICTLIQADIARQPNSGQLRPTLAGGERDRRGRQVLQLECAIIPHPGEGAL